MDFILIENWLKTTVPGIIILGAIGSTLASLVIWTAFKLINKWAPNLKKKISLLLEYWVREIAITHAELSKEQDAFKYHLYFSFHLMKFILFISALLIFLGLFVFGLSSAGENLFIYSVYIPIVGFLISAWLVFVEFFNLAVAYSWHINPHKMIAKEYLAIKRNSKKRANKANSSDAKKRRG